MFLQVCVCPQEGGWCAIPTCIAGGISACLAAGLGGWYPSMPCRFRGPHPRGKFRGIWPGGSPGSHPRGKLRGIWSRPTAKGEVEGDLAGGCLLWGCVSAPGGCACSWGVCVETPVTATAASGTHPTGMHSCTISCTYP